MQFVDVEFAEVTRDPAMLAYKQQLQRSRNKATRDQRLGIAANHVESVQPIVQQAKVSIPAQPFAQNQYMLSCMPGSTRNVHFQEQKIEELEPEYETLPKRTRSFEKPKYSFKQSKFDVDPVTAKSMQRPQKKQESESEESVQEYTACVQQPKRQRKPQNQFQLQSDILDDVRVDTHRVVHEVLQRDSNCFIQRVSRSSGKRYSQLDLDGLMLGREPAAQVVQQMVIPKSRVEKQSVIKQSVHSTPQPSRRRIVQQKAEKEWVDLDAIAGSMDTRPEVEKLRCLRFPAPKPLASEDNSKQQALLEARPAPMRRRQGGADHRFAEYVQVQRAK